jgi:bifunctional enzyme CysN/CysC
MDIVIVGHVDHGKSTIVGRILADTHSLPKGKLEQVKSLCERNSKPFEYAFLLDALKEEQSQGITIDVARAFFKTKTREYTIIDAPGHIEFLKNMVTGASRAEAAVLVIDGNEGVQENSRRHGYILSMLGVKQIAIVINKMDLLKYSKSAFDKVQEEYGKFLKELNVVPTCFIPVAGFLGENIVDPSKNMPWYKGPTIIGALDAFKEQKTLEKVPFRMPVQDVYKFTKDGDDRRIVAGSVETGSVSVGDEVIFYPSGKKSVVKSIEGFNRPKQTKAIAGEAIGFTLKEQIFIGRGEIASRVNQSQPHTTSRIKASVFWLGKEAMTKKKNYYLKLGTAKVGAKLVEISRSMNTSTLSTYESPELIATNSVAECTFDLDRAIAVDVAADFSATGKFVVVDGYEISGGGLVMQAMQDEQSWVRDKVIQRNKKWDQSIIADSARAEKYNQKAALVIIASSKCVERKGIAKKLESDLFDMGRFVYFLGMGNMLYGIGADLKEVKNSSQAETIRRFAEIANILLDAGMIVIATAAELTQSDLEIIKVVLDPSKIETIWIGEEVTTDLVCDLRISATLEEDAVKQIKRKFQEKGIIFKPS